MSRGTETLMSFLSLLGLGNFFVCCISLSWILAALYFFPPGSSEVRRVRPFSRPPSRQNLSTRRWRGNVCVPVCASVCVCQWKTVCAYVWPHMGMCELPWNRRRPVHVQMRTPNCFSSWVGPLRDERKSEAGPSIFPRVFLGSWGVGLGLPWAQHLGPCPGISSKWDRARGLCTCPCKPGRLNEAQICPADPGGVKEAAQNNQPGAWSQKASLGEKCTFSPAPRKFGEHQSCCPWVLAQSLRDMKAWPLHIW